MTQTIPTPQRPWQPSKTDRVETLGVLVASFVLAGLTVEFTGLNGKLGFVVSLFFSLLLLNYGFYFQKQGKAAAKDSLLQVFTVMAIVLTLIPITSIIATVVSKGYKGLHWGILTKDMALASVNDPIVAGGLGHALVGTILMVGGALIISFPIGVLTALYLTEIRGPLARPIRFLVQAMSGVPSIVAGLFIYTTFVNYTNSFSGLAGSLALAVLMLPTVARTAEEVMKLVPDDLRSASYALGARQWRTSLMVILPTVRSGLTTAGILGIARVIGETAPLLLTSLSNNSYVFNPMGGPIGSLPTYVFGLLQIGTENSINRAWTGSLVLMLLVLVLFLTAR